MENASIMPGRRRAKGFAERRRLFSVGDDTTAAGIEMRRFSFFRNFFVFADNIAYE